MVQTKPNIQYVKHTNKHVKEEQQLKFDVLFWDDDPASK